MADSCRIVALGGLGEVGKNMMLFDCEGSIVVVDSGLAFPRDEHLGVDLVLPDFTYLRQRAADVRVVILTHGHEDHVGALPYLLREIAVPEVWATRLTLGLVKSKLDEHGLLRASQLREIHPDDEPRRIGPFRISFVRMAHSIPDCVAVVLETPAARLVHTGDYKLDHTPVDGLKTDVGRLAENGAIVELTRDGVRIVDEAPSGVTFVDGLGVGDVHDVALRDRQRLSEDGVLIIVATVASTNGRPDAAGPPELIARGFGDDAGPLLDELRSEADRVLRQCLSDRISEIKLLQEHLHDEVGQLVYDRTRRRPMILPVVVEV